MCILQYIFYILLCHYKNVACESALSDNIFLNEVEGRQLDTSLLLVGLQCGCGVKVDLHRVSIVIRD